MGLDSDHELAAGEVGKVGVAIDSLADMERIFEGIPLDRVSTSFTINATAPILLAMYQVVGERQGVDPAALRGTVQNDILKEFLARKTYIYPPEPSLRLVADVIEYATRHLPKFNPISVCGYHMRQAGCDAVQEIAFTLANASAYVQARRRPGPRRRRVRAALLLQHLDDARLLRGDREASRCAPPLGADHARSLRRAAIRARGRCGSSRAATARSLTGVEPLNNVVRTTLQTLAIVLSGAQAVHTMSWDEALALPTEEAALARAANAADRRVRERRRRARSIRSAAPTTSSR